jgi:VHL beta domain
MRFRLLLVSILLLVGIVPNVTTQQPLERSATDRPDDTDLYQVHFLYVIPSDGVDNAHDINGGIAQSIAAMMNWMAEHGDGLRFRVDTYQGQPDVTFVRLNSTADELASNGDFIRDVMEAELIEMGFYHPRKLYFAYYDSFAYATSCAAAAHPPDLMGVLGVHYIDGRYGDNDEFTCADTDVFSPDGITVGYMEMGAIHEVFHLLGAAPSCGASTIGSHTSDAPNDLMYAGSESWVPDVLDVNNDDYWMLPTADCVDVATSVFIDPLPEFATVPPDWSQTDGAFTASASLEPVASGLCSGNGNPVDLTFSNTGVVPIELFWVDYDCQELSYGTVNPGATLFMPTYSSHVWIMRDFEGNFVGEYITTEEALIVNIQ